MRKFQRAINIIGLACMSGLTAIFVSACNQSLPQANAQITPEPSIESNSSVSTTSNLSPLDIKDQGPPSQAWGRADRSALKYEIDSVVDQVDHPWSLAFLPQGGMLVTERGGLLKHISAAGETSIVKDFSKLSEAPVHTKPRGQAGLFDIVLHPDYAENGQIFISYAAKMAGGRNTLAVRRFTYQDGILDDGVQIFAAKPARKSSHHYGGRMVVNAADKVLIFPHGDAYNSRDKAQTLDNHFGKILRINFDGSPASDNPFINQAQALPEIWSYGHRNPQGLVLTDKGDLYENEHGPKGGDEINLIQPGVNYGWPAITYGIDYSGAAISPFDALAGMRQSLAHYVPSIAPSGMVQYRGAAFPELSGDFLIPALAKRHVRHVELREDGTLGAQYELFGELNARIRDVEINADGEIFLLIEEKNGPKGKILRVRPAAP